MITLEISHPLFSKARPRVTSKGTFMPKKYKDNQKELLEKIKEQYDGGPLEGPLRVEIELFGEGRADIDNVVGAFFDTANKILWVDDRISIIPELSVRWTKCKKEHSMWVVRIIEIGEEQEELPF
jgi:Holliday junction resolvase RusA-like endonuclease